MGVVDSNSIIHYAQDYKIDVKYVSLLAIGTNVFEGESFCNIITKTKELNRF